ncbi:MAG: DNA polymerase III subunit epsilon [Rubrivivax sp.]|jgi:DNA polymerase-3 subunit epsilon|nr:DNA polymerase III subunit epsilon [Betaproteobacteria bacterium]MBL0297697.1 DNA polymerase III subunit epsilon [Betaproteobacteria bacterium]MBP9908154.1 DNA polymerase III subunit epsilon [Rubrivivax sp.]
MRRDTRLLKALAWSVSITAGVLGAWLAVTVALVQSTFTPEEAAAAAALLDPRLALLVLAVLLLAGAMMAIAHRIYHHFVAPPARLLEQARVLLETNAETTLQAQGNAEVRGLAETLNALVAQREQLRSEIGQRVAEGSRRVEQERSRLAALMSELTQSVVVCNLDGRVLLYNNRARLQFKALSDAPALAGGAELIGLGRSIYTVFDRQLVAHALENIQQRLQRGAATPSAQFVTVTKSGQLLRAIMAPVREGEATDSPLGGFVLMLDNITRDYERDSAQDQLLQGLTEGSRASLGNLQAAVEVLDEPGLDEGTRERFLAVVRDEAQAMARRIQEMAARSTQEVKTRWPLEDMLGADLVAAALRRIEAVCGVRTGTQEVDATLWLKVDSFALLQALAYLGRRLVDEFEVRALTLRLQPSSGRAQLDLIWSGQAMSTETVMSWESEPMRFGTEVSPLSVRDVMQRHGGEFWFERDRVRHQAFFRCLLPLAEGARDVEDLNAAALRHASRPEYYDFDLFRASESQHALDDRRLAELSYTVFDTETTGLDPAVDQIIQIGAARLVNGKLLRQEGFEQLVDPQRSLPAAGIAIHGIQPEMVRGQPTIARVLPAFHTFVGDTVLVAHNAAFDMRFLQLAEARSGVVFDQPVLDTLLLSAVVHPNQESHRLEAIAERFGVTVIGRHTALGDAIVTAEVFLKLIPLLAAMGIHTLGQAREAAQKTYYARLKY